MSTLKDSSRVLNHDFPIQTAHPFTPPVNQNQSSAPASERFAKPSLVDRMANNLTLAQLTNEDQARLSTALEPVFLSQDEEMGSIEGDGCFVYFPESAIISPVAMKIVRSQIFVTRSATRSRLCATHKSQFARSIFFGSCMTKVINSR